MTSGVAPLRVLVLSRSYPNPVRPLLGLWAERPTALLPPAVEVEVISPVPWFPPLPAVGPVAEFVQYRHVPHREVRRGLEVHHPRFMAGPGYRLHAYEARFYYSGVRTPIRRLRRWFAFDIIHAHAGYPDGVVAHRLGQEYGVPVVVTEHAPWRPWMHRFPSVRRQAVPAARQFARHLAVSRWVADTVVSFTGDPSRVEVVPNGVDENLFRPAPCARDANKVLFVGMPRRTNKNVDVLLDAMSQVITRRPDARLVIVGGALYRAARSYMDELAALADRPPLRGRVTFTGMQSPAEVAHHMATSAVLVLSSTLESFGAVLLEALACGTPVVSTRSGGPEDIVTPEVGQLVPVGDASALAEALLDVLANPDRYPADSLRDYVLASFTWRHVSDRLIAVYREALDR